MEFSICRGSVVESGLDVVECLPVGRDLRGPKHLRGRESPWVTRLKRTTPIRQIMTVSAVSTRLWFPTV